MDAGGGGWGVLVWKLLLSSQTNIKFSFHLTVKTIWTTVTATAGGDTLSG